MAERREPDANENPHRRERVGIPMTNLTPPLSVDKELPIVERLPRIPTPQMIAAGWNEIERAKRAAGIGKLGEGIGIREIWQAMYDAALARDRGQ